MFFMSLEILMFKIISFFDFNSFQGTGHQSVTQSMVKLLYSQVVSDQAPYAWMVKQLVDV